METLTVQPYLVALILGIAGMGLPVYQVCRRGVGTLRIDAHRIKPSAWRQAFRRAISAWRQLFAQWAPLAAAVAVMAIVAYQTDASAAEGVLLLGMASPLNTALDKRTALKAEGSAILAIGASVRTPEQTARLSAIEAEVTALDGDVKLLQKFAADEKAEATIQVGTDRATLKPWGFEVPANAAAHIKAEAEHNALGNFALAVKAAATGHSIDPRLQAAATGMGTQVDSSMGFAVPHEVAPGIEREMYANGDILSRCDVRTIGGNSISYNVLDETSRVDGSRGSGVLGYWVDEGVAPTLSNMKLARIDMKLRKVGALGAMTDELLSDATALGGELQGAFTDELIFQTENKVFRGNGANSMQGFLNAPCLVTVSKETGQAAASINTTNLSKMWARLPARSKKNSAWFINVDCEPQLDELAQAIGTGGTAPRFVTYDDEGVLRIKGRPVIQVEYAESVGTVGDIVLADLKKYRVIRKGGVEQASSMHVYFAQGEQAFRAFYRVDGQAAPRAAVTPFKGSATQSPFVVLATRA